MGRDVAVRRDNVVKSNTKDKGMAMSSSDIKSGELEESNFSLTFACAFVYICGAQGEVRCPGEARFSFPFGERAFRWFKETCDARYAAGSFT